MMNNSDWMRNYLQQRAENTKVYGKSYHETFDAPRSASIRKEGSKSTRLRSSNGIIIEDMPPSKMPSNGCFKIHNQPIGDQVHDYTGPKHTSELSYDGFIPTGETYEYLPCAPYDGAADILGFQEVRGVDTIMQRFGDYNLQNKDFKPYSLLLYRGRLNNEPTKDDSHRFIYLAEPGDLSVGDCFIRLEEVHERMRGNLDPYIHDCEVALRLAATLIATQTWEDEQDREGARKEREAILTFYGGPLRFRCWTVAGAWSPNHEEELTLALFHNVKGKEVLDNDIASSTEDHIEEFRVWAWLLRRSQGDKLASKDFFGRYWDAVIPDDWRHVFKDGFKIIVGAKYFQDRQDGSLDYENPANHQTVKEEVYQALQRAIDAPRLKFKPPLTIDNVFVAKELNSNANDGARSWFDEGWRCLDGHPGGLYDIVVNLPVRQFLCLDTHKKPLWQEGYGNPLLENAQRLQIHLDRCGQTEPTTTFVNKTRINGIKNQKRNPTQDKCVAHGGYSANTAMSDAYPGFYPNAATAKKRRVAEWLHRSAFSYGGYINGIANKSQTANNLVLGTPATNTVMMRYEAFVKRLAFYGIAFGGQQEDIVTVQTKINYTTLAGPLEAWVAESQLTWLAPDLGYNYYNNKTSKPHVSFNGSFCPMNRENTLLFLSLLDRSLEAKCWGWNCWNNETVVVEALLESTGIDGDQEETNKEEVKEKLRQATAEDQEGEWAEQDLNHAVLNLVQ